MAEKGELIFITGGVRSGKSSFAELLAVRLASKSGANLHYIASGQASDLEMKERITRHQKQREESGYKWTTWEQSVELAQLSTVFHDNDLVLFDCLTTLLNNEFFKNGNQWRERPFREEITQSILKGIAMIQRSCKSLIIVSNEVLFEPTGTSELVFTYGKVLGNLHQAIVARASHGYHVEAGIPLLIKGESL